MRIREIIDIVEVAEIEAQATEIRARATELAKGDVENFDAGQIDEDRPEKPLTPVQVSKRAEKLNRIVSRTRDENARHQAKLSTLADQRREV